MMTMNPLASSSSTASTSFNHPNTLIIPCSSSSITNHNRGFITFLKPKLTTSIFSFRATTNIKKIGSERVIYCGIALKTDSPAVDASSASVSAVVVAPEDEELGAAKIGARVRVKVPLKVYHVPKVPEIDIFGMEGVLKQYVGLWKGKRISANLPFKVEFFTEVEGRGSVKFFAHLKEDEFEYIDQD